MSLRTSACMSPSRRSESPISCRQKNRICLREPIEVNDETMRKKVLFICVHNIARSQMTAALLTKTCGESFTAHSAGLAPAELNPLAMEVLREIGIDISKNKTRAVFDVFKSGQLFPFVITVCSETEAKGCPIFPGVTTRLHWPFDDPSKLNGTWEEKLAGKPQIRRKIEKRSNKCCNEQCATELRA